MKNRNLIKKDYLSKIKELNKHNQLYYEKSSPKILADIQLEEISRIATTFGELDRVL